jgi:hypothetical protein
VDIFSHLRSFLSQLQHLFRKSSSFELSDDKELHATIVKDAAKSTVLFNDATQTPAISVGCLGASRNDSKSDKVSSAPIPTPRISPANIGGNFSTLSGSATSTLKDGPGVALDAGSAFGGLIELRAASLVGDSHILEGTRRQDAYAVRIIEDMSRLEIAVCDGVGSRVRSHEGAAIVATSVVQQAANGSTDPVGDATAILARLAKLHDTPVIEFSTTLIWVRVDIGIPGDTWNLHLTQYGDGAVKILRKNNTWHDVTQVSSTAEFDHNSFALPLAHRPIQQKCFNWSPEEVLFLASDGISDHLDEDTKVGHFLANSWQSPPDRWTFLSHVSFRTRGAGDDRTIVAIWRTDNPNCH